MQHLDQLCHTARTQDDTLTALDIVVMGTGAVLMLIVFVLMLTLPNW